MNGGIECQEHAYELCSLNAESKNSTRTQGKQPAAGGPVDAGGLYLCASDSDVPPWTRTLLLSAVMCSVRPQPCMHPLDDIFQQHSDSSTATNDTRISPALKRRR